MRFYYFLTLGLGSLPLFVNARQDDSVDHDDDPDDSHSSGIPGGDIGYEECSKYSTPEVTNVPYPGDCSKYIKCDFGFGLVFTGISTVHICDAPLHFSPVIQTCVWPENAGCESD
ncbi:hypothetical protein ASPWEDRAFT_27317 [Aspergillus wentii DTO 134E9]|uniref:Chitin-binding type-2 domain-containing protein n=1 Tax=Aspergillus wentii DTO 134E9 TaxID=1073089 RepID=A0A1L9RSU2_ASPWE|nr:uncharacterized protein ASPWEDRAFT_27317 [Aspergillus wentii DTO 134E9]OJJ38002.1 hypothetical protein ASPWEDRAFT_27317 [Aspergillus wentii DTO 134E9]